MIREGNRSKEKEGRESYEEPYEGIWSGIEIRKGQQGCDVEFGSDINGWSFFGMLRYGAEYTVVCVVFMVSRVNLSIRFMNSHHLC